MGRFSHSRLADLRLRGALLLIVAIAAAVAFAGAVVAYIVDPGIGTFGDALWWSVTAVTTTGFGDVVPTDAAGRVVGVILMMVGISLIPTVTSLVVAVFIAQRTRETEEVDRIHRDKILARLDELEAHLTSMDNARG